MVTEAARRVLVVDDEEPIRELVRTVLTYEGFDVATAASGRSALAAIDSFRPALVVLDIMLPDLDGFEVQRRLSDGGARVPVLFLSAREGTDDKVRGLTLGGDDYVTKPFSLAELVARVHAVLRRTAGASPPARLTVADLELDDDAHEVRRAGCRVELTPTEYKLLRYLMANARRVLSKAQILDHVWSYDFGGDAGVVETNISHLRRKVDASGPALIHTIRGVGYTIRPPDG